MASLPLPTGSHAQKPSISVEALLRHQLSRFLVETASWKAPFREMIDVFRKKEWKAVFFGGVPRDLVLYGPSKRPRDVDIVVDCSPQELDSVVASYPFRRTRFGGFRIAFGKWSFDIWSLRNTWAFASGYMDPTFDNLPKTTFFNVEAIAAQFNTKPRKRRSLYSFGFSEAISSRVLDINFEPNPFPQLCIIRGLVTAARHRFLLSPRLATYILERATRAEIAEIMHAQFAHYGVVHLRTEDIMSFMGRIEFRLKQSPSSPVSLPQMDAQQLMLPSFDHVDV
jgi:hypothetical protein